MQNRGDSFQISQTPPFSMTLGQVMRGGAWRLELAHSHETPCLIWLTRGQGRAMVAGERFGIGPHTAIFVPADTLISLHPGPQAFGQILHLPHLPGDWPPAARLLRLREATAQNALNGLIEAIQRDATGDLPFADDAVRAHVQLLAVWLKRQLGTLPVPKPNAGQKLMAGYSRAVAQGYASEKVMADYAADLQVTPTHLTRVAKALSGQTAAELLTERVLHAARDMLTPDGPRAVEISRRLGFGSAAYFTRFIQHHTGKTPSALRQGPTH